MDNFIPYAKQDIQSSDIEEVCHSLSEDLITRGPRVEAFEQAVAAYCQARYAVAFNSGSTALKAAYYAAQVGPYDRILTSPNTYVATSGAAEELGATPVFIDIDRATANLDGGLLAFELERKRSRGRNVVVPIHFSGAPVDVEKLDKSIADPDVVVIEDAAHALGSSYPNGVKVGSCAWSDMAVFSFHPAKQITSGEGGMVTTNDPEYFHRLKLYRNNGIEREKPYLIGQETPGYYEVHALTGNYNFTEFQAALGLSQFKRIDEIANKRRKLLRHYKKILRDVPHLSLLAPEDDGMISFHLCVARIDFNFYKTTRAKVMQKLQERGIGTQVHYIPLYRHPYYVNKIGDVSHYFPEMELYYSQALSLPLYTTLSIGEVDYVAEELKKALQI